MSTPLIQVAILAIPIALVMAFFPIGLGLIVMIGLILVGSIARGVARSSDTGRWIAAGIYTGALVGFVLSVVRAAS